jgi:pimeloyl-ACP methyl ester carboxylesterase
MPTGHSAEDQRDALPLVLLPGTLCDARMFDPLLARLAPRRFLPLALHGGRDAGTVADRILAEAPPRFALLGFSLGGIVALEIAARAPERVAGLAMIDSNSRDIPIEHHAMRRAQAVVEDGLDALIERLWPNYVGSAARGDSALRATILAMAQAVGADALADQTEVMLSRADSRPRLGRLAMPALVLAGEEDALCPPAMQHELADGLPNAVLALIDGAGHFAPLERPDAVADHVAAWLDRVDRSNDIQNMLTPSSAQEIS